MNGVLKMTGIVVVLIAWQSGLMAQHHTMMPSDSTRHQMQNVTDLKWMDAPPGLPKGAKVAVLSGDPSKTGLYTIRVSFPKGYAVRPHTHPTAESITVIEGTLFMGTQETFDKLKAGKLEKGGFAEMPANFVHYAFCEDPAVVQIHGMGPFTIKYVNKNDDPRNTSPLK